MRMWALGLGLSLDPEANHSTTGVAEGRVEEGRQWEGWAEGGGERRRRRLPGDWRRRQLDAGGKASLCPQFTGPPGVAAHGSSSIACTHACTHRVEGRRLRRRLDSRSAVAALSTKLAHEWIGAAADMSEAAACAIERRTEEGERMQGGRL